MDKHVSLYISYLESLQPDTLNDLKTYVSKDIHFKDPFNDVHGLESMTRIFAHMFDNIQDIKFKVLNCAIDKDICLMEWQYEGILRGAHWQFKGTSVVRFSADGKVVSHIDYWDAASDFYERLPLVGSIIRWIKARLAVH